MGYSKQIYARANAELKIRRARAENTAAEHKAKFRAVCPEALDIENEMAKTGLAAVRAVGAGKDAVKVIENLAKYNLELQSQRKMLLTAHGFPEDYLTPAYTCPVCEDNGTVDGRMCDCYQKLLRDFAFEALSLQTPLKLCSFDSFSLGAYADIPDADGRIPREEMQKILNYCKNYAENFSESAESLFLYGKTGLGKTHLSLSIASAAVEKGYGVIYGTAQNLLTKLEKERFGKAEDQDTEAMLLECDLLILDDLGTEFRTAFTVAEIYNLINTRELLHKPTIINSNLNLSEMKQAYTDRVTSRILGSYRILHFCGNDMRIELR